MEQHRKNPRLADRIRRRGWRRETMETANHKEEYRVRRSRRSSTSILPAKAERISKRAYRNRNRARREV